MWYRYEGLTETMYGWSDEQAVADAAAEAMTRQYGTECWCRPVSEAEAIELDLAKRTDLVCAIDDTVATFDPRIERFPALVEYIREMKQPVRSDDIIEAFEDTLLPGDEHHEDFLVTLDAIWGLSPCTRRDWMAAYCESPNTPPHTPVYATDEWVLATNEDWPANVWRWDWECCPWRELPELTGGT